MSFKGKYILVGIDGTSSHEWRNSHGSNSHVFQFHQEMELQGGISLYWNGPGKETGGVIFGAGSTAIVEGAVNYLRSEIRRLSSFRSRRAFISRSFSSRRQLRKEMKDKIRIVLVGHSRGGLIAINIARKLPLPVYFMGLYDAVDRHIGLEGDTILNVDLTFHALRHPVMKSRTSFSNCGLTSRGVIKKKYFHTSHGGIGGDAVLEPTEGDYSCDIHSFKAGIHKMLNSNLGTLCTNQSSAADAFIRDGARGAGIRF